MDDSLEVLFNNNAPVQILAVLRAHARGSYLIVIDLVKAHFCVGFLSEHGLSEEPMHTPPFPPFSYYPNEDRVPRLLPIPSSILAFKGDGFLIRRSLTFTAFWDKKLPDFENPE